MFFPVILKLALIYFCKANNIKDPAAPLIQTKYGAIQGYAQSNSYMYLGIPFAQPPVANLRWKPTIDVQPWAPNIYNATLFRPACPQSSCSGAICPLSFNEDCLYLNVYVPQTIKTGDKKAVMLFIHGGNFQGMGGNSPLFNSTFFAAYGDVVVVTINYRLGALGFLVTGLEEDQAHGNYGILDQKQAIKWTHDNIGLFGGDTDRITIFGQSAGAESVSIHLLSEDMQTYYKNAIIQSSPMSIPFRQFDEMILLYTYFADFLNCSARDMDCLRSKTSDEIVDAQYKAEALVASLKLLEFFEPWLPYIDGKIIKGQLLEIEKWIGGTNFTLKPFIISTLTEECVLYVYGAWGKPLGIREYILIVTAAMKKNALKVLELYPPELNVTDQRALMSYLATIWVFSCSSRNFLENYMSNPRSYNNVYYMSVFDFPLDFDGWGNDYCPGHVCHGADMPYTFDVPDANMTSMGHKIALEHITYWSNYAKNESPNTNTTLHGDLLYWPNYERDTKINLRFKAPNNFLESFYLKSDCDFLDSIGYYYK